MTRPDNGRQRVSDIARAAMETALDPMPPDIARRMVAHARDARGRLVLSLMAEMGLMCHQVAALKVGDVDLMARRVVITGSSAHTRTVALPSTTARYLREYLAERRRPRWRRSPLVRFDRGRRRRSL